MRHFGLLEKLYAAGMVVEEARSIRRWQDGSKIGQRPGSAWMMASFGEHWHAIHRADYQDVLLQEARRLGVGIRLGVDVISIDCDTEQPAAILRDGQRLYADVVVGADGLHSSARTSVIGRMLQPRQSGDLAYRITIPTHQLKDDQDSWVQSIVSGNTNCIWWGDNMHVVCYLVRDKTLLNLALWYVQGR